MLVYCTTALALLLPVNPIFGNSLIHSPSSFLNLFNIILAVVIAVVGATSVLSYQLSPPFQSLVSLVVYDY